MPKYKSMDKSSEHNMKYMSMLRGKSQRGMEYMMNHGNTSAIDTIQNQERGKLQLKGMDYRGTPNKAFDYKY